MIREWKCGTDAPDIVRTQAASWVRRRRNPDGARPARLICNCMVGSATGFQGGCGEHGELTLDAMLKPRKQLWDRECTAERN